VELKSEKKIESELHNKAISLDWEATIPTSAGFKTVGESMSSLPYFQICLLHPEWYGRSKLDKKFQFLDMPDLSAVSKMAWHV